MNKFYLLLRSTFILTLSILLILPAKNYGQTTVVTPIPTGLVYFSDTDPGCVVFGVKNNNTSAITVTDVGCYVESGQSGTYTLWYNPTTVGGAPGIISAANGWIQTNSGNVTATSSTIYPIITGLSITIPAGGVYRFALSAPVHHPYYGVANSTANVSTLGGVDIYLQNNPTSPGYAGAFPGPPGNTPRSFFGSISYVPVDGCVSPPSAGQSAATSTLICNGNSVTLDLINNSIGTGQTYQWQSSATAGGPYTNVGPSSNTPLYTFAPTTSMYYQAVVSCGGQDRISTPIEIKVNNLLPGGNYTIDNTIATGGSNFQTFTDAVNALSCGVTGSVVFNVKAGQTFNEDVPQITGSGTSANRITFQRSSDPGANPKIIPVTPGTVASSTTIGNHGDAILIINGGDYITFDAIDLETNPSFTGIGMMEYGYYLKKASVTNACKNVTIKNSVITLNKAAILSFGIAVSNIFGTATAVPTSTGGRSENIKISGNTINNSYCGILLRGYVSATPFDLYDQNIEVGVDSANTIMDYAGGPTAAYGIYAIYQNNIKIGNNRIVSGTGHTTTLYGIFTSTGTNSNVDIYNNIITVHGGGTTTAIYGINNDMGASGTNNLVKIYNNQVINSTYPTATTGAMNGIEQGASAFKAHIYGNTVSNNNHTPTTTGAFTAIFQSGAVVNESKVYNNTITNNSKSTGTSGIMYGINHSPATTSVGDVYNNTISGNVSQGAVLYGIALTAGGTTNVYKNNIFNQTSNAAAGSAYGISATSGTTNNIYNNFISELYAPAATATTDAIRGINVSYTTANTSIKCFV